MAEDCDVSAKGKGILKGQDSWQTAAGTLEEGSKFFAVARMYQANVLPLGHCPGPKPTSSD